MKHSSLITNGRRKGLTLVELTITVGVVSLVLASLCEIFFAVNREWGFQQGQATALDATSQAISAITPYLQQAVDVTVTTRLFANDALVVDLPADTAHGIYIPRRNGTKLNYQAGQKIIFYLSDSSGSYLKSGDILWCGTAAGIVPLPIVTPDQNWSLYPNGVGKVTPIDSIQFTVTGGGSRKKVTVTVSSDHTTNGVSRQVDSLQQSVTVALRNFGNQ